MSYRPLYRAINTSTKCSNKYNALRKQCVIWYKPRTQWVSYSYIRIKLERSEGFILYKQIVHVFIAYKHHRTYNSLFGVYCVNVYSSMNHCYIKLYKYILCVIPVRRCLKLYNDLLFREATEVNSNTLESIPESICTCTNRRDWVQYQKYIISYLLWLIIID